MRSRGTGRNRTTIVCLVALASVALTCTNPVSEPAETGYRFVEEEPAAKLVWEDLLETKTVVEWDLDEAAEASQWRAADAELVASGRGIGLGGTAGPSRLVRTVDLDAAEIDVVTVQVNRHTRTPLTLLWARAGESFDAERSLERRTERGSLFEFSFAVSALSGWSGQIQSLAIESPRNSGQPARLRRVSAHRVSHDPELLAKALQSPWKVNIRNDVRNAFLVPPGVPVSRTVAIDRGSHLSFSYGATSASRTESSRAGRSTPCSR